MQTDSEERAVTSDEVAEEAIKISQALQSVAGSAAGIPVTLVYALGIMALGVSMVDQIENHLGRPNRDKAKELMLLVRAAANSLDHRFNRSN